LNCVREDNVPLSEEELRLLEQMERALVAEDPKLASTMRGTSLRAVARRRMLLAGAGFVVGVAVLMTGAVSKLTVVGIIGFVLMLGSAYVALSSWRGQHRAPEPPAGSPASHPTFSVIEGGRKKRSARPARNRNRNRSASHGSMMERFEERWRRRRDQNGF
jgi:hypothetical protein